MKLEKRRQSSPVAMVLAPLGAVLFTLLISALLVLWAGAPVGQTYALLLQGGFGSVFAWSETLTRAIPLILTGLAAAVAFKARLFNIGAEGQLYVGALAAVAVGGALLVGGERAGGIDAWNDGHGRLLGSVLRCCVPTPLAGAVVRNGARGHRLCGRSSA